MSRRCRRRRASTAAPRPGCTPSRTCSRRRLGLGSGLGLGLGLAKPNPNPNPNPNPDPNANPNPKPKPKPKPKPNPNQDDVLHMVDLPSFAPADGQGGQALGQHDAELLLSFLTVPYLRGQPRFSAVPPPPATCLPPSHRLPPTCLPPPHRLPSACSQCRS